jgi:hypothetical protein
MPHPNIDEMDASIDSKSKHHMIKVIFGMII